MLGRTKDQIRTTEQVNAALTACKNLNLDGLVIIGGEYALGLAHVLTIYLFFILLNMKLVLFKGSHQTQMLHTLLKHLLKQNAQQR